MSKIEKINKFRELILSYLIDEISNMEVSKSVSWFAF